MSDAPPARAPLVRIRFLVGLLASAALLFFQGYDLYTPSTQNMARKKRLKQAQTSETQSKEKSPILCRELSRVMGALHHKHVRYDGPSRAFDRRVIDLFAERLDPMKLLVTQAGLDRQKRYMRGLLDQIRRRRCGRLEAIRRARLAWLRGLVKLSVDFVSNPDVELLEHLTQERRSRLRPRAQTIGGLRIARMKNLHFELAAHMATGDDLETAKEKVKSRYTRILDRAMNETSSHFYRRFLRAYANAMDPHTDYLDPNEYKDFDSWIELSFVGIGFELNEEGGYIVATRIFENSPAQVQGGLRPMDRILAITQLPLGETIDLVGVPYEVAAEHLTGPIGSQVKLTINRMSPQNQTFDVVVTRDRIKLTDDLATLSWETVVKDGESLKLAVLKLGSFYRGTGPLVSDSARDVKRLLRQAVQGGAQGLVFDLSSNSGGLVSAAVRISGLFMESPAVVMLDGDDSDEVIKTDPDPGVEFAGPMVVLTSRVSASAAEVTAAALQDYRRAVIVGDETTWGKGSYQNVKKLRANIGGIKVTRGRFFRPSGRSTQGVGVVADIIVPSQDAITYADWPQSKFALPLRRVNRFMRNERSVISALFDDEGEDDEAPTWRPVAKDELVTLSAKSQARLEEHPRFLRLAAQKTSGVKTVREVLQAKSITRRDDRDIESRDRVGEALEVLSDLVLLRRGPKRLTAR